MDDGLARLPQYQAAVDALRRALMQHQMQEAQDISDAVPRRTTAVDTLRRALMLRQMQQAQEISDAVPRRADDPLARAIVAPPLPEWPVSAPWPGSPRSNRVA